MVDCGVGRVDADQGLECGELGWVCAVKWASQSETVGIQVMSYGASEGCDVDDEMWQKGCVERVERVLQ